MGRMGRGLVFISLVALLSGAWGQAPLNKAQIAFSRTNNRTGLVEMFTMDTDGKNQRPLAEGIEAVYPTWSPDGGSVIFPSLVIRGVAGLYMMDADGRNFRLLYEGNAGSPRMSPGGTKILFEWRTPERPAITDIFTLDVDGGNVRRLTNGDASSGSPTWSPDGREIAFVTKGEDGAQGIYVMSSDGEIDRRLTPEVTSCRYFGIAWSPNGREIAYACWKVGDCTIRMYVAEIGSGRVRKLTRGCETRDQAPVWSPNGKRIAFTAYQNKDFGAFHGKYDIYVMNRDGRMRRRLTHTEDSRASDWYDPAYPRPVTTVGKLATTWGELKIN